MDLETVSRIVGHALLGADLVTARGAHTQGKKKKSSAWRCIHRKMAAEK